MCTLALITSHAPSLLQFRAPLISELRARGVRVLALAPNFDENTRASVECLGATPIDFPMVRTGMNPIRDAFNTWRLFVLLRSIRPDISLGYFIKPVIFGTLAAWLAGVPRRFAMIEGLGFVFTYSGGVFSIKRRLLKQLVLWLYRLGISRAHRVIFLNPDDQDELVRAGVLARDKGFLLGGIGVDLERWRSSKEVLNPITFMMVGRLLREKGVVEYSEAARIIKRKYPHVRFILLGALDDNPGSMTDSDVQEWCKEGILEWHGHTAVEPWMAQTSVFVLPSFREGVPMSTQEAMAMGRAVITTDVPGCRQTVLEGVNGFLVPPRDAYALAERMERFIEKPELIVTMGSASRQLAEEHFDVRKVNQRLVGLLLGGTGFAR